MQQPASRRRRKLVVISAGVAAAAIGGFVASRGSARDDRDLRFASIADARAELARLARGQTPTSSTSWSWAQTLIHCAQSIEYSMTGFPQMKPALFQRTLGSAAIAAFSWRGRMTHDLAEPIPGAPSLDVDATAAGAMARLQASMQSFAQWAGPLRPHFAYGELAKPAYERAHAMHLANHLSAFAATA